MCVIKLASFLKIIYDLSRRFYCAIALTAELLFGTRFHSETPLSSCSTANEALTVLLHQETLETTRQIARLACDLAPIRDLHIPVSKSGFDEDFLLKAIELSKFSAQLSDFVKGMEPLAVVPQTGVCFRCEKKQSNRNGRGRNTGNHF